MLELPLPILLLAPRERLVEHQGEPLRAHPRNGHQLGTENIGSCFLPGDGLASDPDVWVEKYVIVAVTSRSQVGVPINLRRENLAGKEARAQKESVRVHLL